MKIQIKELGAVKEATIDLEKKLILFCGQNNTGKTYLASAIYALCRLRTNNNPLKISFSKLLKNGKIDIDIDPKNFFEYRNRQVQTLKLNLDFVFGISDEVVKQLFENFEISILENELEYEKEILNLAFDETIIISNIKYGFLKKNGLLTCVLTVLDDDASTNTLDIDQFELLLTNVLSSFIVFYPIRNTEIFPVERNSIYTFNKELSATRNFLIEQVLSKKNTGDKELLEFLNKNAKRYPLATRSGLKKANDTVEYQKYISDYWALGCEIEDKILKGPLSVSNEGEIQFVLITDNTRYIPFEMTASLIKTLSNLILYLKHEAQKGDLIIIDEPEMNLHPDSQILLAKVFAKLINNGFRLLISTHSDYIIREFNNLIMISSDKPEVQSVANEYGYAKDEAINPNDVGVYYFHFPKASSKQVVVKELKVDESGFEVESIDKEIIAQNERAMSLNYAINFEK